MQKISLLYLKTSSRFDSIIRFSVLFYKNSFEKLMEQVRNSRKLVKKASLTVVFGARYRARQVDILNECKMKF